MDFYCNKCGTYHKESDVIDAYKNIKIGSKIERVLISKCSNCDSEELIAINKYTDLALSWDTIDRTLTLIEYDVDNFTACKKKAIRDMSNILLPIRHYMEYHGLCSMSCNGVEDMTITLNN